MYYFISLFLFVASFTLTAYLLLFILCWLLTVFVRFPINTNRNALRMKLMSNKENQSEGEEYTYHSI